MSLGSYGIFSSRWCRYFLYQLDCDICRFLGVLEGRGSADQVPPVSPKAVKFSRLVIPRREKGEFRVHW